MNILVTRIFPGTGIHMLEKAGHNVTIAGQGNLPAPELISQLSQGAYQGLLCMLTDEIDAQVFDAAPDLKIVANYAVGYDNIDIEEAKRRGITITNTPDVLTNAVAEHTLALMLSLARRIPESDRYVRAGKWHTWEPDLLLGSELRGKMLGLIGGGRIGTQVARIATRSLGMSIIYHDISQNELLEQDTGAQYASELENVLESADVISLHVPLTEKTRHLIDAKKLSLMRKNAYLINTSRGAVIDEKALTDALKNGVIAGAALDVYENEPAITPELLKLNNVVLTPHTASATREARGKMGELAAQSIIDALAGKKPKNKVV